MEKDLDNLYKLLPHCPADQIFAEDSNSFKLNLFPIPFKHDDEKELWDKKYASLTGFATFEDYQKGVITARQQFFQKLVQKGKHPKTIFCFSKVEKVRYVVIFYI